MAIINSQGRENYKYHIIAPHIVNDTRGNNEHTVSYGIAVYILVSAIVF